MAGPDNWLDKEVIWEVSPDPIPYETAVARMEGHVAALIAGKACERIWLLEHPCVYTAGTSARAEDLLDAGDIPVIRTPRGGQFTYHGPGQRVVYVMLDLNRRRRDIRAFIRDLEGWIMDSLASFSLTGKTDPTRVGVWVDRTLPDGAKRLDKIAAIGVRLRKWVTFHGISVNVEPDLALFDGINPCGISEPGRGVTSLIDLGYPVTMADLDEALKTHFERRFGPTVSAWGNSVENGG